MLSRSTLTFQAQVLALLLQEAEVLTQVRHALSPEFFEGHVYNKLSHIVLEFFDAQGEPPSSASLTALTEDLLLTNNNEALHYDDYYKALDFLYSPLSKADLEFIKGNLEKFIIQSLMRQAALGAVDKMQQGENLLAAQEMEKAATFSLNNNERRVKWSTYNRDQYLQTASQAPVPTGYPSLDEEMHGGLRPGEVGIILGTTGTGKSQTLVNLARNALEYNRRVLYVTLEMPEWDVQQRLDAAVSEELFWDLQHDIGRNAVAQAKITTFLSTRTNAECDIDFFPMQSITVPQIKAQIKRRYAQSMPEIIYIDYADLIRPSTTYQNNYDDYGLIYAQIVGMAKEFNIPIWTASQANRQGRKARILDIDHLADSYKKSFVADVVYAITQSMDDRERKLMFFYSAKMRNHAGGKKHYFRTAFERSRLLHISESVYQQAQKEKPPDKDLSGQIGMAGSLSAHLSATIKNKLKLPGTI